MELEFWLDDNISTFISNERFEQNWNLWLSNVIEWCLSASGIKHRGRKHYRMNDTLTTWFLLQLHKIRGNKKKREKNIGYTPILFKMLINQVSISPLIGSVHFHLVLSGAL